ncbi:MAG: hypothetical protein HYY93_10915 [Planctomycetes bacterium]|nr:hypothetical protein [Planctomycetota bacterium]
MATSSTVLEEDLSLKEWLLFCRRVERSCAQYFIDLAERVSPSADSFHRVLRSLAAEEEAHAAALDRYDEHVPWPLIWHLDESRLSRMMKEYFPSLSAKVGNGPLASPEARRRARAIEEESWRFYREMAARAKDEQSRHLFRSVADGEQAHMARVRKAHA